MSNLHVRLDGPNLTYTHDLISGATAELAKLRGEYEPYFIRIYLPAGSTENEAVELVREAVRMMSILNNQ